MPTTTPNRGYTKPDPGGDNAVWGDQLNSTIDQLDTDVQQAIDDSGTVSDTLRQLMIDMLNAQDPVGTIKVHNSASAIPAGWSECNGTNSTPDLRGRVLVCEASASRGRARGTKNWDSNVATTTVNSGGSHTHGATGLDITAHVGRSEAHALTKSELPNVALNIVNGGNFYANAPGTSMGTGGAAQHVTRTLGQTEAMGLGHGHNHQIDHDHGITGSTASGGSHTHAATTPTGASYATRFIQKTRLLTTGDLP